MDEVLVTERLRLEPITMPMIEAVTQGDWDRLERLTGAKAPQGLPGPELIHRGFGWSIERVRRNPEWRLWGDRLAISRHGERRILGSVLFHGHPGEDGIAHVAYGIDDSVRNQGLATEGTRAAVTWALSQRAVLHVHATAHSMNTASQRVLEKVGMKHVETRPEAFGDLLIYSISRADLRPG